MLDDDIQYLGTKSAQRSFSNDPLPQSPQIVTGIILRIENSADDPACALTFHRSDSSVVHIGRRPSNEEKVQTDPGGAMFRCAVVSRKHAKIAFSDSGHVYLIDMNSHHGTHICSPGEISSRMLKPETPTKLGDGDTLTFGKSVGRHNEYVRPVVARVELIHNTPSEDTPQPALLTKKTIHVDLTRSTPPRLTSGRYGVYIARSSSPDNLSSSASDQYSDIEEIPASGPNALPLQPRGLRSSESDSQFGRALETLKRLLPPVHIPGTTPSLGNKPTDVSESPIWSSSPVTFNTPPMFNSPPYSPHFPDPEWSKSPQSHSCRSFLLPLRPSSYTDTDGQYGYGFRDHERSRSTSPMDLASPSLSPPPDRSLSHEEPELEDRSVVGAWPDPRSSSPELASPPIVTELAKDFCDHVDDSLGPSQQPTKKAMSLNAICSESRAQRVEPVEGSGLDLAVKDAEGEVSEMTVHEQSAGPTIAELHANLEKIQTEVVKLQSHRRKYKARFNTNVHLISDKLSDLDERMADVNAQYTMLLNRVDHALDIDISDLRTQVNDLRHMADTLLTMNNETSSDPRSDVKASIETLRELVVEMRNLRESTQKQMNAELDAVRAARDAALDTMSTHVKAQISTIPLKRRRLDDSEMIESRNAAPHIHDGYGVGASDAANVTMADIASFTTYANTMTVTPSYDHDGPPRKRARRIAKVAVQTATAVTVGAIATWSALAFS